MKAWAARKRADKVNNVSSLAEDCLKKIEKEANNGNSTLSTYVPVKAIDSVANIVRAEGYITSIIHATLVIKW